MPAAEPAERTLCAELARPAPAAAPVELVGWVAAVRRLGGLTFLVLRDRSGCCQCTWEGEAGPVPGAAAAPPPGARRPGAPVPVPAREAVVRIRGLPRAEPRAPGGVEVAVTALEVLAAPQQPPPFALHGREIPAALATVLDHRPASLRHPRERAAFVVQAALVRGFRRHLDALGFTEVHTPKIVGGATEGAGAPPAGGASPPTGSAGGAQVFSVDYFGRPAYLAQSPQLYKQVLVAAGFERVYEVGAVYRAEPHDTARHLNEYVSLDVETELFAGGGTAALIAQEQALLAAMFAQVASDAAPALDLLGVRGLPDPLHAVTLTLEQALRLTGRPTLDPEAERRLAQRLGEMVYVTGWPVAARPFYAMAQDGAPALTHSFDLIFRGLEVTTGGQREHRLPLLAAEVHRRGIDPAAFAFYMEAFALGAPPHGGFAIGLERLTAQLLGMANIRRAALFPRDRARLAP